MLGGGGGGGPSGLRDSIQAIATRAAALMVVTITVVQPVIRAVAMATLGSEMGISIKGCSSAARGDGRATGGSGGIVARMS